MTLTVENEPEGIVQTRWEITATLRKVLTEELEGRWLLHDPEDQVDLQQSGNEYYSVEIKD